MHQAYAGQETAARRVSGGGGWLPPVAEVLALAGSASAMAAAAATAIVSPVGAGSLRSSIGHVPFAG
jgi:hypothetical protein